MSTGPSWKEFLARKKEEWWAFHPDMGWVIYAKKKCPKCGAIFCCHDCQIEYYLCWRCEDWRNKTECECPKCLRKSLGSSEGILNGKEVSKSSTNVWAVERPPDQHQ